MTISKELEDALTKCQYCLAPLGEAWIEAVHSYDHYPTRLVWIR